MHPHQLKWLKTYQTRSMVLAVPAIQFFQSFQMQEDLLPIVIRLLVAANIL